MANSTHHKDGGVLGFLHRNCGKIQRAALLAFVFLAGLALGNHHVTENALDGQARWYQHSYTPAKVKQAVKKTTAKVSAQCAPEDL